MPTRLLFFAAALAIPFLLALGLYRALRATPARRMTLLLVAALVILPSPLLVPAGARFLRALAAVWAAVVVLKMYDLHRGAAEGDLPTPRQFLEFLPNVFGLVHRKLADEPKPPRSRDVKSLLSGGALALAALVPAVLAFAPDWKGKPFPAEHAAKVVSFFLVLVPATHAGAAAWRLLGGRARAFMDNPFAARTPADFWRRYNRPVHQFLQEDVFRPLGGARHPVRAALLSFLVSAAIHEYVFTVAVGRVQGYQTAFFILQGLAVVATLRLKPCGWRAAAWTAGTFAFNLASGILFFGSVNEVLPFYDNPPPLWDGPAPRFRSVGLTSSVAAAA